MVGAPVESDGLSDPVVKGSEPVLCCGPDCHCFRAHGSGRETHSLTGPDIQVVYWYPHRSQDLQDARPALSFPFRLHSPATTLLQCLSPLHSLPAEWPSLLLIKWRLRQYCIGEKDLCVCVRSSRVVASPLCRVYLRASAIHLEGRQTHW